MNNNKKIATLEAKIAKMEAALAAAKAELKALKPESQAPIAEQIKMAYVKLAKRSQDWVYLRDLRPLLQCTDKEEVDKVIKEMFKDELIYLTLMEDQKRITDADRAAAIRIGISDKHMLSF